MRAPQIGPLVATGTAAACALLAAALAALPAPGAEAAGGAVPRAVIDLRDAQRGIAAWIAAHGAREQRPFTRMALGADPPGTPGAPMVVAVAGPEFG